MAGVETSLVLLRPRTGFRTFADDVNGAGADAGTRAAGTTGDACGALLAATGPCTLPQCSWQNASLLDLLLLHSAWAHV